MIKALKKKFILTSMVAVTVLLFSLLVIQNVSNYSFMNNHSDMILNELARLYGLKSDFSMELDYDDLKTDSQGGVSEGEQPKGPEAAAPDGESGPGEDIKPQVQIGFNYPDPYDNDIRRASYFTVIIDPDGNVKGADASRDSDLGEEKAQEMALTMFEINHFSGWYNRYKYTSVPGEDRDTIYIFLNRERELDTQRREILVSIILFIGCFGILLLLVMLLSNTIIKPIVENLERQKDFVTFAGHEIKTPLAIIQANTEVLELHSGENKWTKNIKDQTMRLSVLMNNMLTLTRAEEGFNEQTVTDVDLSSLLHEILAMYQESFARKDLYLFEVIEEGLTVKAEKSRLSQLLSLIFDNTVKYAKDHTQFSVIASGKDRLVELECENFTEFLPECEPERLFERFYRPDSSRYSEQTGNGIGLSAARAIMGSFGGSIVCRYGGNDRIIFTMTFRR